MGIVLKIIRDGLLVRLLEKEFRVSQTQMMIILVLQAIMFTKYAVHSKMVHILNKHSLSTHYQNQFYLIFHYMNLVIGLYNKSCKW